MNSGNTRKVIPTEVFARVVGYYRSVSSWNDGKQKEWESRKIIYQKNSKIN